MVDGLVVGGDGMRGWSGVYGGCTGGRLQNLKDEKIVSSSFKVSSSTWITCSICASSRC